MSYGPSISGAFARPAAFADGIAKVHAGVVTR